MEYFIIVLFFLLAVLIIVKRVRRFLRELYQPGFKNESEAYKKNSDLKKKRNFKT